MSEHETPLPPAFVHFRDLFRIHMKKILTLDRKPPMHAATLLVLVACEALSKLLGRTDECDVFAKDLLGQRHDVPYHVGKTLFNALRNGLAHEYATWRIVVGGERIRPILAWKLGGHTHLKLIGVRRIGGQLHRVPLEDNEDSDPRLSIVVGELLRDLDDLFTELEKLLRANTDLAATVQANAATALVGDTKKCQPEGPALDEWREYLRTARWERPPRRR